MPKAFTPEAEAPPPRLGNTAIEQIYASVPEPLKEKPKRSISNLYWTA